MEIHNITSQLPRKGDNPKRKKTKGIIVHWDGVNFDKTGAGLAESIAHFTINKKLHNTLQYHIRISHDALVYQCLDLNDRVWHCSNYFKNLETISICLEGMDRINDSQLFALRELIHLIKERYSIEYVKGHREVALPGWGTSCPGGRVLESLHSNFNLLEEKMELKQGATLRYDGRKVGLRNYQRLIRANREGGAVVHTLKKGDAVTFLGTREQMSVGGRTYDCFDVDFGTGTGWVWTENFSVIAPVVPTPVPQPVSVPATGSDDRETIKQQIINLVNKL